VIYTAPSSVPLSVIDNVSYTVSDQHNDAVATGSAGVQLDAGPTIAPEAPEVVEKNQTTVIGIVTPGLPGDTLTLVQTGGTPGTLSLDPSTGNVIYTAPSSIPLSVVDDVSYTVSDQHNDAVATGSADVQLDSGPKAGNATLYLPLGQSVDLTNDLLALDTPGLPGDTLMLTAIGVSGTLGAVTLTNGDLTYVAPTSGTLDAFTYTVSDQHHDAVATGNVSVTISASLAKNAQLLLTGSGNIVFAGNGNDQVTGGTGNSFVTLGAGNDHVSVGGSGNVVVLGSGNDQVSLSGSGNVVSAGAGNDSVVGGTGNERVTLGDGNDQVSVGGAGNVVSLGNGNDSVTSGADSMIGVGNGNDQISVGANSIVTLGTGHDTVTFGLQLGNEVINGFGAKDQIVFNHALLANYMAVLGATTQVGSNTVISVDANDSVTLTNVAASKLSSANFHFA
jgi:Ca2+-binding RTX toxin-like protein